MHDDLVVVGLGNGLIETYEVVRDDGVVELIQEDSFSLHTHDDGSAASVIRLAVNPVNAHVASSSTDQRISVVDAINGFDSGAVIMRQSMGDLVPALSWDRASVLHAIWGSENPCSFLMLDERAGLDPTKAAFSYHSGRYNMFSMKQYSEYGVLLGFEGGEIRHIDVRTGNRCDLVFYDPYVPAIAGFEFSPDGKSFVTSGLTDFTMWSMDNSLRAHVVAHSGGVSNRVSGETGYMVHASFLDDNTILSTDSEGFINRFSIGSDAV